MLMVMSGVAEADSNPNLPDSGASAFNHCDTPIASYIIDVQ